MAPVPLSIVPTYMLREPIDSRIPASPNLPVSAMNHYHIVAITKAVVLLGQCNWSDDPGSENPIKLSEANLSCGDIFIIINASTQQGVIG